MMRRGISDDKWFLGIDLGGTKIGTGLVNRAGVVRAEDYRPTEVLQGQEAVIERMIKAAREVIAHSGMLREQVEAVGIGAPGPMNIPEGVLIEPPNLPGWRDVPIRKIIQDALGIPTYLENDANAAGIGEYLYGAGRGTRHMIYVTVSTGIGGGLILDGKIYHGTVGGAGEIGHTTILPHGPHCGCGNRGCLEAMASGTAIAREGQDLVDRGVPTLLAQIVRDRPYAVTAKDVVEAMNQGDGYARDIIEQAMNYLGIGMASLVNLFNPQMIVIGGGLTNIGDLLLEPVKRGIDLHAFPSAGQYIQIRLAELGDQVGIVGAAGAAMMATGFV
ncbi:MAG: ROK family protein [Anaerolineae bacterium]|nr:ROK family protein [Anaerolineae bacterium]